MFITVAICTFNRAESLRLALDSLVAIQVPSDLAWEIVIVNNNSTDHTDDVISEYIGRWLARSIRFVVLRGLLPVRDRPGLGTRESAGSSPSRREHRATHLYSVDSVWIRTMMQSYASAAKLQGGGPILNRGAVGHVQCGLPPPRIVICSQVMGTLADCRNSIVLARRHAITQPREGPGLPAPASGRQSPKRDQQLTGEGYDHGLARRAASVCSSCPIPLGPTRCPAGAPGSPRRPAASHGARGVAGFGKAPLTSLFAALVRSSRQTRIARYCFAIPQVAGENLLNEHIRRLDADPDHPGEQVDHRIVSFSGCPLQPLDASRLNLFDLLFHEA